MTSANLGFLKFNQCAFHQAHIILLLTTTPHSAGEGSSWRTLNSFYVRPLATWSLGVRVFNYLFDPYSQWWVDLGTHTQHYTRRRRKEDNHNPRYSNFFIFACINKNFPFFRYHYNIRNSNRLRGHVRYRGLPAYLFPAVWPRCLQEGAKFN